MRWKNDVVTGKGRSETGIEKPRHEDIARQAKLILAFGVDHHRTTANLCRRIGIVSATLDCARSGEEIAVV